ncbi:unnamed protein product [Effrenium voratum]|uniref:Auxin efflux carrier n=1 Tax=Effrenium voratum TaxID=2562239 RepID=A0AA36HPH4_9DINO|nr:unnamed protein product [Effrenium voratum]
MAGLFAEALLVSVYANVEVLLICCAGIYAVHRGVVPPEGLKILSRLIVEILFPFLAFSNFRAYSWELLGEWYLAGVGCFLTMVLGALLGKLGTLLLRLEPPYSKIFILSTTFGNVGALPYVLLPNIVSNWKHVSDVPETLYEGYGIISLCALVWNLVLFGLGRPYALSGLAEKESASEAPSAHSDRPCFSRVLQKLRGVDCVVWASLLAILVGCIAPLRDLLSDQAGGALRFVGSFSYQMGSAGVRISTLVLGGSLYLGGTTQLEKRRVEKVLREEQSENWTPQTARLECQAELGETNCCSLSPMVRLAVGATFIKLVLMPAISIPLIVLAVKAGAIGRDQPMLFMVLMIQTGVPSAQTTLALVVSAGLQKVAGEMSIVYIPMYVASVVTVAIVIVISVTLFDTFDAPGKAGPDAFQNATL